MKMNGEAWLAKALQGYAVVRALTLSDKTMTYEEFGRATGIVKPRETRYNQGHQSQATKVLQLIDAIANGAGEKSSVDFNRIIVAKTGSPGSGVNRISHIVTTKLPQYKKWKRGKPLKGEKRASRRKPAQRN